MKQDIIRLIAEGKDLLKDASPQQKLRFLKLMKESMRLLNAKKQPRRIQLSENSDYIDEK